MPRLFLLEEILTCPDGLTAAIPSPRDQRLVSGSPYVNKSGIDDFADSSYMRIPIPTPTEAEDWRAALCKVPANAKAEVSREVDYAMRFAGLAYARNNGAQQQMLKLSSVGTSITDTVELQFHGTEKWGKGAHLVAYLYKLNGHGAGVVLVYKGSTLNAADWGLGSELDFGGQLFANVEPSCSTPGSNQSALSSTRVKVHNGFLKYAQTLDHSMEAFKMDRLRDVLNQWGASAEVDNFSEWLYAGLWEWCVVVGHSLGGSMAQIKAAQIAVLSQKMPSLVTIGSPTAGNMEFVHILDDQVLPGGGLRIINNGDIVPLLGYKGISSSKYHAGITVSLSPRFWHNFSAYYKHLRYEIPSTVSEAFKLVNFIFPQDGFMYKSNVSGFKESRGLTPNLKNFRVVSREVA